MDNELQIQRVKNIEQWFHLRPLQQFEPRLGKRDILLRHVVPRPDMNFPQIDNIKNMTNDECIVLVSGFATLRIGDIGNRWDDTNERIPFKYAKILLGDLFEFYTSPNGVLTLPTWSHLQYALDEFLEDAPQFKYHPSRVQAYAETHGVEHVESMD